MSPAPTASRRARFGGQGRRSGRYVSPGDYPPTPQAKEALYAFELRLRGRLVRRTVIR
jgi:hypothetical protein